MNLPDIQTIFQTILIILAILIGLIVLRTVLKATARLLAMGCFAVLFLGALAAIVGWAG
jgi:hypothetical protein